MDGNPYMHDSCNGRVETINETRVTKEIYMASVGGRVGRGRPRRTYHNQFRVLLKEGQVKSPSMYVNFDDT